MRPHAHSVGEMEDVGKPWEKYWSTAPVTKEMMTNTKYIEFFGLTAFP
jgi:hypothetical protein